MFIPQSRTNVSLRVVALLAVAGGVPLFVRDICAYYRRSGLPEPSSASLSILERLQHACELFDDAQEAATQTATLTHFNNVQDGLPEHWLLQYVLTSADFALTNSLAAHTAFLFLQFLDVCNTIFGEACGTPNPRRMAGV